MLAEVLRSCAKLYKLSEQNLVFGTTSSVGDPSDVPHDGYNSGGVGWGARPNGAGLNNLAVLALPHQATGVVAPMSRTFPDCAHGYSYNCRYVVREEGPGAQYAYATLPSNACFNGMQKNINNMRQPVVIYRPYHDASGWGDISRRYFDMLRRVGLLTEEMYQCVSSGPEEPLPAAPMTGNLRRWYQSLSIARSVQEAKTVVMVSLALHEAGVPADVALAMAFTFKRFSNGHTHYRSSVDEVGKHHSVLGALTHAGIKPVEVREAGRPHLLTIGGGINTGFGGTASSIDDRVPFLWHLKELHNIILSLKQPFDNIPLKYGSLPNAAAWQQVRTPVDTEWAKVEKTLLMSPTSLAECTHPHVLRELSELSIGQQEVTVGQLRRIWQAVEDTRAESAEASKNAVSTLQPAYSAYVDEVLSGVTYVGIKHELPAKEAQA